MGCRKLGFENIFSLGTSSFRNICLKQGPLAKILRSMGSQILIGPLIILAILLVNNAEDSPNGELPNSQSRFEPYAVFVAESFSLSSLQNWKMNTTNVHFKFWSFVILPFPSLQFY